MKTKYKLLIALIIFTAITFDSAYYFYETPNEIEDCGKVVFKRVEISPYRYKGRDRERIYHYINIDFKKIGNETINASPGLYDKKNEGDIICYKFYNPFIIRWKYNLGLFTSAFIISFWFLWIFLSLFGNKIDKWQKERDEKYRNNGYYY